MPFSGDDLGKLQRALFSAFPKYADLEQMDRIRLDANLPEIVRPGDMRTVSYDLIRWAEAQNRLDDLVRGARAHNPGNPDLKAVAAALGGEAAPTADPRISLAKLPSSSPLLVGRERELALLDDAWADPHTHVVEFVAWGGVGKTALVNKWLAGLAAEGYRGAARVFGWSFYSQGAAEGRQASADPFIAAALRWFGDPEPDAGSPWDKGERLAEWVRRERTLLVLDGLEPLQYPPGELGGRLRDPGMATLLRELAHGNPGLCVVTTRLAADELADCEGATVRRLDLEALSPEAGEALLRILGVQGTAEELQAAATDYGGHALALTLLGSLLSEACDGDIRRRREVGPLTADDSRQGAHARQVMTSYEKWLGPGLEQSILHLMGLFDRPAEGDALAALRAAPPIPGLTDALFRGEPPKRGLRGLFSASKPPEPIPDAEWNRAVIRLRRARLLDERDPDAPEALDAHPLVREHFGEQLRLTNAAAWREAHGRLYDYYKGQAPELPDTLEAMAPLYAAVAHGCAAGRHQEARDEVYRRRIQQGNVFYATKKLGAFGADLVALAGFFDPPWLRPVAGLTEADKAFLLNQAGYRLRALGRLAEAREPMLAGLEIRLAQERWLNAAIIAGNLSELALAAGDLPAALRAAEQSVELADRSDDAFERMVNRTTLADALHQAGRTEEAASRFREAEEMQQARQALYPLLYSLGGYQYCDLLLKQGQAAEVLRRAGQTLEWYTRATGVSLLDIALDHLSLGRAHLMLALDGGNAATSESDAAGADDSPVVKRLGRGNLSHRPSSIVSAASELDQAVTGLRQSGNQDDVPRGLLARAALRRVTRDFERARHDLDEALGIAARGGMRLHEADCRLEYARLFLAMGNAAQAREHFAVAKRMVAEMGYGRRDREVAELEVELRREECDNE